MIEKNELMADDFVLVRAAEEKPIAKTDNNAFDVSKTFTTVKAKNKKTGENETFLVTSERDIEIQMEIGVLDEGVQGEDSFKFMENDFTTGEEKIYSRCPDNFLNFLNQYFLKYNRYPNINTNLNYYKNYGTEQSPKYEIEKSIQGPLSTIYKTSEFPFEQINEYMQKVILDSKGEATSMPMTDQHYYIQDTHPGNYCDCLITKAKLQGTIHGETPTPIDGTLVMVMPESNDFSNKTFTLEEGQVGKTALELDVEQSNIVQVTVSSAGAKLVSIDYPTGKITVDTTECKPGYTVDVQYKYMNSGIISVKDAYPCRYLDSNNNDVSYEWGIIPNTANEGSINYKDWVNTDNYFGTVTFLMNKQKEGETAPRYLDRLYFSARPIFEKLEIDLITFTGATEDAAQYLYALEGFFEENFNRQLDMDEEEEVVKETEENARFKIVIEIQTEETIPKLIMKMETSRFKRVMTYGITETSVTLSETSIEQMRQERVLNIGEKDMYLDHNLHLPEIYRETEDEIPFSLKPADYHTI